MTISITVASTTFTLNPTTAQLSALSQANVVENPYSADVPGPYTADQDVAYLQMVVIRAGATADTALAIANNCLTSWDSLFNGASPPAPSAPGPWSIAQLLAYADSKANAISDGGISVNIAASGAPQMVSVSTNSKGRIDILGLMDMAQMSLPLTWYQSAGDISITAQQLTTIALAVASFRAAVVALATRIEAGIQVASPPTITTSAQIDDPTTVGLTAWPSNS